MSRFLVILGVWLALGLLDVAQQSLRLVTVDQPANVLSNMAYTLPAYVWLALLTPVVFALADRFPFRRGRNLAVHAGAALAFPLIHLPLSAVFTSWVAPNEIGARALFMKWAFGFFAVDVFRYAALVGVHHALRNARRAADMQVAMVEAQLQSLTSRIRPHFLFNSLNVISGVALQDSERAATLIAKLSDLLRRSLRQSQHTTTLREELEFARAYLDIEQARLGERLRVTIDVPAEMMAVQVPSFLLQPLVENAVQHGVARVHAGGAVTLRGWLEGDVAVLEVRDTGRGFAAAPADGLGLSSARTRLATLYGDRARLETENPPDGGAVVTVRLPA